MKFRVGATGGGGVAPSVLQQYTLKTEAAAVDELQQGFSWPLVSTSVAEQIRMPPVLAPTRLGNLSIVNSGTGVGWTSTDFWTVGIVKVVPTGPLGAAPALVRICERTTVAQNTDLTQTFPGNPGLRVYDATPWSFGPSDWHLVDPDNPSNPIPPTVLEIGDHLLLTFTPTGTPGAWGPRAVSYRLEPREDAFA